MFTSSEDLLNVEFESSSPAATINHGLSWAHNSNRVRARSTSYWNKAADNLTEYLVPGTYYTLYVDLLGKVRKWRLTSSVKGC